MGSTPGVSNVQAGYTGDRLDTVESIRVYDGILTPRGGDIRFGYSIPTVIDELVMPPVGFVDGEWTEAAPLSGGEDYWFEPPVGLLYCRLSLHSEVLTLPLVFREKGIRECTFKINHWGLNPEAFAKAKLPADLSLASPDPVDARHGKFSPRDMLVTLLADHVPPLDAFVQEPEDATRWAKETVTEVRGTRDGQRLT